jgi:multidrug efflux system outer membrane protein
MLAAVLPALLLSGCNMAPRYARPAAAVPPPCPRAKASTGGGCCPDPGSCPHRLARIFPRRPPAAGDRTGLANNQDLRLAVANVQAARAQYRAQRADLFPAISASGSGTYTNTASFAASAGGAASGGVADIQYFTGNVGLSSFEIDLFGRVRNLTKAAQEQYLASEEGRRATRVTLIGEIAAAWLTLASDRDQLATSNARSRPMPRPWT